MSLKKVKKCKYITSPLMHNYWRPPANILINVAFQKWVWRSYLFTFDQQKTTQGLSMCSLNYNVPATACSTQSSAHVIKPCIFQPHTLLQAIRNLLPPPRLSKYVHDVMQHITCTLVCQHSARIWKQTTENLKTGGNWPFSKRDHITEKHLAQPKLPQSFDFFIAAYIQRNTLV